MTSTKRMDEIAYMFGVAPYVLALIAVIIIVNREAIAQLIKSALTSLLQKCTFVTPPNSTTD
ncbi:MAG: hypothetical protein ACXVJJ_06825 [Halobacteriota archaeon]